MSGSEQVEPTKTLKGPIVAGQLTVAHIFSSDEMRRSAYLPSLQIVVNAAYKAAESSKPELGMKMRDRLSTIDDFFTTLGNDTESFTTIVSHQGSSTVIGTASVRRYHGPPKDDDSPWLRRVAVEPGTEEWELKMMATDPAAQGGGVATFMVRLVEEEIVRRFKRKISSAGIALDVHAVRMVLCTPTELFGSFYQRRGYVKDYENYRGDGCNFHIIFMSKLLYDAASDQ